MIEKYKNSLNQKVTEWYRKKIVLYQKKKNDRVMEGLLPGHEEMVNLSLQGRMMSWSPSSVVVKFHVSGIENNTPREMSACSQH